VRKRSVVEGVFDPGGMLEIWFRLIFKLLAKLSAAVFKSFPAPGIVTRRFAPAALELDGLNDLVGVLDGVPTG